MTETTRSSRFRDARTFAAGASCGFLAGAFAVSVVVWQYGNVIGSRQQALSSPAQPPSAIHRWEDGMDDAGPAVLEHSGSEPAPTTGHDAAGPPAPAAAIGPAAPAGGDFADRNLQLPVDGVSKEQLTRQFHDKRGSSREHEAIDILAPRNTPVRAVEDGRIARLFLSKAGGMTIYQFDPTEQYCYYYAHLERYADNLREGDHVQKGQVIGYVGTSGNAPRDTPHLHFAVFQLTPDKHWWEGTPIDPYDVLR